MQTQPAEIKELEDKQVAYVSFKGNYMGNTEVFAQLFDKLFAWAGPKGILPEYFIASYQDDYNTTPPEEWVLNLCMPIKEDVEVEGEIQKKVLPGGKYAVMRAELEGPQEYGPAWEAIVKWANENGYEPSYDQPSYEYYLNNPEDHPEKHHILDVCLYVKEK